MDRIGRYTNRSITSIKSIKNHWFEWFVLIVFRFVCMLFARFCCAILDFFFGVFFFASFQQFAVCENNTDFNRHWTPNQHKLKTREWNKKKIESQSIIDTLNFIKTILIFITFVICNSFQCLFVHNANHNMHCAILFVLMLSNGFLTHVLYH